MTPHISANKEDIAKVVIMPGDPLRAKMIAEVYLTDYRLVSDVRNIYAYTGKYKGVDVTIMASGMGMPSMGIYSYELYKFYDVDTIIRVGSCGGYTKEQKLYDLILAVKAYSKSTFAKVQDGESSNLLSSTESVNLKIMETAKKLNLPLSVGIVNSTDVFYSDVEDFHKIHNETGAIATEMESFALFHNAKHLGKKCACILTVSDNLETKEETTSLERQNSFTKMIELALESIL